MTAYLATISFCKSLTVKWTISDLTIHTRVAETLISDHFEESSTPTSRTTKNLKVETLANCHLKISGKALPKPFRQASQHRVDWRVCQIGALSSQVQ